MVDVADYHDLDLLPQHAELLAASAIAPEVAIQRGYWSATKKSQLKDLGFSDPQCRPPTLVVPVFDVTGKLALHQIRPDAPRASGDGKPRKYEMPRGAKMTLDIPLGARKHIENPRRPLFITEGVRKADSAISHGLCCIALLGVWNWRGTNKDEGKTILVAWEYIALEGREVFIVFDSDVMTKEAVYKALVRLKAFLESRGALVKVIYLEPRADGGKVGLDDFFAAGGVLATLLARATEKLKPAPNQEHDFSYRETPHGLIWLKPTRDGAVETPLCNFTARIVAEVVEDNGVETRHTFVIDVHQGARHVTLQISAERFATMNWAMTLGYWAVLAPGQGARDHARVAIQYFSQEVQERHVYTHIGWREIGEQHLYLHAGGAIGAEGVIPGIEVAVSAEVARFTLPPPPTGAARIEAIHRSMDLLRLLPPQISYPAYMAVWRAPLGKVDNSPFLLGKTGTGKSEYAARLQQHWGSAMDRLHLPANFISTANQIAHLAFLVKDAILTIDDFCPTGSLLDAQRTHKEADRIFRAQGNNAGRGRLRPDGTAQPTKPPRGMMLGTGEDAPRGQSLQARLCLLEIKDGDMDWALLAKCQHDGAAGIYAEAMAAYVQWLAPRMEHLRSEWNDKMEALRSHAAQGTHKRTPEVMANLAIGFSYFLDFALEAGAISAEERAEHWRCAWAALGEANSAQARFMNEAEPTTRFIELLVSAIASGHAHVAALDGSEPEPPSAWGWREHTVGTGDYMRNEWQAKGTRIGWVDEEDLYLDPNASFSVAQAVASRQGEALALSAQTLRARLKDAHYLKSWDTTRQRTTIRKRIEGRDLPVLHLAQEVFTRDSYPGEQPSKPSNEEVDPEKSWSREGKGAQKPSNGRENRPTPESDRPTETGAESHSSDGIGRFGRSDMEIRDLGENSEKGTAFEEGSAGRFGQSGDFPHRPTKEEDRPTPEKLQTSNGFLHNANGTPRGNGAQSTRAEEPEFHTDGREPYEEEL